MEAADERAGAEPPYRPDRRGQRPGYSRGWRQHLARSETRHHRPQPDPLGPDRTAQPLRRASAGLCHHPPARRADHDDLPRCHRKRRLFQGAQGTQRRPGGRRPPQGRVRGKRLLRTALAADQYHRLCRPAFGHGKRQSQRAAARIYRLYPRLLGDAGRADRQYSGPGFGRCRHCRTAPRNARCAQSHRQGQGRAIGYLPRDFGRAADQSRRRYRRGHAALHRRWHAHRAGAV
ncbi:hypothetical protein D9M68_724850 [compost metagenome]